MIFLGDIHGEFYQLKEILKLYPDKEIIQLGDMGLGFNKKYDDLFPIDNKNLKFIRGNHDNPEVCKQYEQYLGDYGVYKDLFFISGAASIDKAYRIENVSWWKNEELTYLQQKECMDLYLEIKPRYVITHDCPQNICACIYKRDFKNSTGVFYQNLFDLHQPEFWIFAHHHKSINMKIKNTQFIGLDVFEVLER